MSPIQSVVVDERGGFMSRQHPAQKACVCVRVRGGLGYVCRQRYHM